MTALFAPGSQTGEADRGGEIMPARLRAIFAALHPVLPDQAPCREQPAYQATWWHNRIFNPDLANDAVVLAFTPDWKSAKADPWPDPQPEQPAGARHSRERTTAIVNCRIRQSRKTLVVARDHHRSNAVGCEREAPRRNIDLAGDRLFGSSSDDLSRGGVGLRLPLRAWPMPFDLRSARHV